MSSKNPLATTINGPLLPTNNKKRQQQEEEYERYRKKIQEAKKGFMLISEYKHGEIEHMTNIYEFDEDKLKMIFKGHYDETFTKQIDRSTIERKTTIGHIIDDRHDYVKIVDGKPEKAEYATDDMYGGKSRKNKRTNKRTSRKNRKSRKIRK